MNENLLIHVKNISKSYKSFSNESKRFLNWFNQSIGADTETWIFRNISFDIKPGESLGIVGQNGAGKSTLLKILSGVLKPTEGYLKINGRISSILELGTGFHPDFTGRANVKRIMTLYGHSPETISNSIHEVETFADIGIYFDKPIRIYSSGMHVRLAFSALTAIRPDILIIDEALSVGDASFQRKCFQRIEKYREEGTSLIFVSHNLESVKTLCSKAIFIAEGTMQKQGNAKEVCEEYEKYLFNVKPGKTKFTNSPQKKDLKYFDEMLASSCEVAYGDGRANISNFEILNKNEEKINIIYNNEPFIVKYSVEFNENVSNPIFAMMLKTAEGISIYGTDSTCINKYNNTYLKGSRVTVSFQLNNNLAPGLYYFNCGVREDHDEGTVFLHRRLDVYILKILNDENATIGAGLIDLRGEIFIKNLI